jgi:hypothetical protein
VSILWLDDQLESAIKLDSIVTVSSYSGVNLMEGEGLPHSQKFNRKKKAFSQALL